MSTLLALQSVKTDSVFHKEVDERINEVVSKYFTFTVTMEFSGIGDFSHLENMTPAQRNKYMNELFWRRNDKIEGIIK
jgi:hypothetical protein